MNPNQWSLGSGQGALQFDTNKKPEPLVFAEEINSNKYEESKSNNSKEVILSQPQINNILTVEDMLD